MTALLKPDREPLTRKRDGGRLEIAGRDVSLTIVEHKRARRLTLRIEADGRGVRVTAPPDVGRAEIDKFVDRNRDWLENRICRLPDRSELKPGMKVPVRGVSHRIVHVEGRRGITKVDRNADGPVLVVFGDKRFIGRRITDFLKKQAGIDISPLIARHSSAIGKRVKSVKFNDTTSRWGSCSVDGDLSFSWRIMMAPPAVIDYLVAHEVAHLEEMNHGSDFWRLCEKLCPKTEKCKSWLKRNGGALQAMPF